jgi:hypothetical protein
MLFEFLEQLKLDDIRVRAPTKHILLCGGQMSDKHGDPAKSLRDAFFKIVDGAIPADASLLRAEDVNAFVIKSANYDDFLRFESDIAQVCELVLLFSESEGSFSELGSFCSVEEIRKRTMVVIEDRFFNNADSYIRLGPLQALLNEDGSAVVTFTFKGLGSADGRSESVDRDKLKELLRPRIDRRLKSIDTHTRFDSSREGHAIKVLVGFCQEFGAMLPEEILLALQHVGLDITDQQLSRFILCGSQLEWIKERRKGDRRLILANPSLEDIAAQFLLTKKESGLPTSSNRRRAIILEHWQRSDVERFNAIVETRGAPWAN